MILQTHLCPHLPLPLSSGLGRLDLVSVGRLAPRLAPDLFWLFGSFALVFLAGRPSLCSFLYAISLRRVWSSLSAQDSTLMPRSVLFHPTFAYILVSWACSLISWLVGLARGPARLRLPGHGIICSYVGYF